MDAACAFVAHCAILGCQELSAHNCDLMKSAAQISPNRSSATMASAAPVSSPTGSALPFDKNANGIVISEGFGVVILKRLADAQRDGDRIYAVVKGVGKSSDGKGLA
ncbi:MAG: beta-ketoacyl synthase N-terminal-like domain-containing protein [Caldilineaceae bacterium]